MLGDLGGERGGRRVVDGALLCQLPARVGLRGRVQLYGPGVGCAGDVSLSLKALPAAKDLAQPGRRCRGELLPYWGRR